MIDIPRHVHPAFPTVESGVRLVRIKSSSQVPEVVGILNFPCRVFYHGQPKSSRSCKKSGHLAKDCPLKDKSFRCGSAEHVAHNCTNDWNTAPAAGDLPCPAASRLAESATPRSAASGHQSAVSSATASQVPSSCPCCFRSDSSPHPSSVGPSINTSKSGLTSGAGFSSGMLVL